MACFSVCLYLEVLNLRSPSWGHLVKTLLVSGKSSVVWQKVVPAATTSAPQLLEQPHRTSFCFFLFGSVLQKKKAVPPLMFPSYPIPFDLLCISFRSCFLRAPTGAKSCCRSWSKTQMFSLPEINKSSSPATNVCCPYLLPSYERVVCSSRSPKPACLRWLV